MTRRKQQAQQTLWEGILLEDVKALWEPWMVEADKLLEDEELIERVYEAQGERYQNSSTRGRSQTPAELVLRLLLLKHIRDWSYDVLEREVRANLVQIQEAENQIITHYEVFEKRPSDRELLLPAVEAHQRILGRIPRLVAADAGFYSQAQERAAQDKGVRWIAVPNRNTHSAERKKLEKSRWFRKAQAWRTGCEGRISVVKRRHGLSRCRYRGAEGMKRWVGLGVIADNLINIGNALVGARA